MALQKVFTQLQRPLQKKRKFFVLVIILLLLVSALGAAYYFKLKSEEEYLIRYKTHQIDNYFHKLKRKLDNDKLIKEATNGGSSDYCNYIITIEFLEKFKEPKGEIKKYIQEVDVELANCINKFVQQQLDYKKDFDEYVIQINKEGNEGKKIISSSSFSGLKESEIINTYDTIRNNLWFTHADTILINHNKYLSLSKRYSYENYSEKFEITFIGLTTTKNFRDETMQLDPIYVGLLVMFLLLLLFGLPFLKMAFISEDERLLSNDVILAGLSTVIGAPLVLIVFLSVLQYYKEHNEIQDKLDTLTRTINKKFETENDSILKAIVGYDFSHYQKLKGEYKLKNKDTLFLQAESKNFTFDTKNLSYFKYVSQLDKGGKVKYHINYLKAPPASKAPRKLEHRNYFKDLTSNRNVWYNSVGNINYVMRPVVSIENSSEEAVYARYLDSISSSIGIFSVQLKSLHTTKLPIGFQFAVIDPSGKVWFHSQQGKSTLENLYDISEGYESLKAAVKGRVKANGKFNYHGDDQLFATLPVKETNLSIITFYDTELIGLQISETLSISSIVLLIIALFLSLVVILSILEKPKRSLIKFAEFKFSFLLPKQAFSNLYLLLTLFFIVVFIILSACNFSDKSNLFPFFLILLVAFWSYLLCYYVFRFTPERAKTGISDVLLFSIAVTFNLILREVFYELYVNEFWVLIFTQLAFFLLILLLKSEWIKGVISGKGYGQNNRQQKTNSRYKRNYVFFLTSFLASTALLPAFLIYQNANRINEDVWKKADLFEFARHYQMKDSLLTKGILLPIDRDAFIQNSKLNDSLKSEYYKKEYENYKSVFKELILDHQATGNYYFDSIKVLNTTYTQEDNHIKNDKLYEKLVWKLRPIYNERFRKYQYFSHSMAYDDTWLDIKSDTVDNYVFQLVPNQNLDSGETNSLEYKKSKGQSFFSFIFLDTDFIIFNLIVISFVFGGFYWLILFYVERCFAFRFYHLKPSRIDIDDFINGDSYNTFLSDLFSSKAVNHNVSVAEGDGLNSLSRYSGLFIIGPPSTGKQEFAKKILSKEQYKTLSFSKLSSFSKKDSSDDFKSDQETNGRKSHFERIIDTISVNNSNDISFKSTRYFILEHFEHNILSFEFNRQKAEMIAYLLAEGKKVIIISEIFPSQVLDVYKDQVENTGEMDLELANDFSCWQDILDSFYQVHLGIAEKEIPYVTTESTQKEDKPATDAKKEERPKPITVDQSVYDMIKKEFGFSNFLPHLSPIVYKKSSFKSHKAKDYQIDEQHMVMHGMHMAHGYYTGIWNTLPRREKYILYDLARDGFMNIKNSHSLFSLMKKGLIIWDDIPRVFNQSFRNFIISYGKKDIELSKEQRLKEGSSWGTTRILIFIIIITIIVFIVIGNPDLVKNLESFYTALAGIGALIPVMATFLGRNSRSQ